MMSIEAGGGEYGNGEVYSDPDELVYWCMKNGCFKLDNTEYRINLNPREGWYIEGHECSTLADLMQTITNLIDNHETLHALSYTDIGNAMHDNKDSLDRIELESAMSTAGWCYAMDYYKVERSEADMSDTLATYMAIKYLDIYEKWEV